MRRPTLPSPVLLQASGDPEEFDPLKEGGLIPEPLPLPPCPKPPAATETDPEITRLALTCLKIMGSHYQKQGTPLPLPVQMDVQTLLANDPLRGVEALRRLTGIAYPWDELGRVLFPLSVPMRITVLVELRRLAGWLYATAQLFESTFELNPRGKPPPT